MEYQNNLLCLESKRIHQVLKHKQWLEQTPETPLNFTELSANKPQPLPSWFSQLAESEKQELYERLAHLEVIFRTVGEEEIDKVLTDKNSQIINENYEIVRSRRRIAKDLVHSFEKAA